MVLKLKIRALFDVIEIDIRNRLRRLTGKKDSYTHTVSVAGRYIWCLNYHLGKDDNFGNGHIRHSVAKRHGVVR